MLNNSGSASVIAPLPFQTAATQRAFEFDRSTNEHIRELLRHYGLRTSLIRFKVINPLVVATREGRSIGVHAVHAYLESCSVELSFISVREVLKRLCDEGVILFAADKSYRFTSEACAILKQHSDA